MDPIRLTLILKQVAAKRDDKGFQARLKRLMVRERSVLDRLSR